jgi:hypothetical protein
MRHVSWPKLMPLSLRLRTATTILATGQPYEAFAEDSPAEAVLGTFDLAVAGQMAVAGRMRRTDDEARHEGPALDAYFSRVGRQLVEQADSAAKRSQLAGILLTSLADACSRPVCRQCASQGGTNELLHMCRWTSSSEAEDDQTISTRGACLQPITELFSFARDTAMAAYENACKAALPIVFEFTSGHDEMNNELDLAIHGLTNESADSPLQARVVRLRFCVESFGVDDYLSLPYVLLHECLVHGLCGVDIEDQQAIQSIAFHEGWMDCVAYAVLKRALAFPVAHPGHPIALHPNQFSRQTLRVRETRFNRSRPGRSKDVMKWILGEYAFHAMSRIFAIAAAREEDAAGEMAESNGLGLDALIEFSLSINQSDLSHSLRAEFVRNVNRHYVRQDVVQEAKALVHRPQVIDFTREYLATPDFSRLVYGVLAIR